MPIQRKYVFNITPRSHVRSTQGDSWVFRIPEHKLRPASLVRKKQLERYNAYKLAISSIAKEKKFYIMPAGTSITFFFPVPASWSKKKKARYHLQPHLQRPDLDNCIKAMLDSMLKEDKHIYQLEASKYWVNAPEGHIEIVQRLDDEKIK